MDDNQSTCPSWLARGLQLKELDDSDNQARKDIEAHAGTVDLELLGGTFAFQIEQSLYTNDRKAVTLFAIDYLDESVDSLNDSGRYIELSINIPEAPIFGDVFAVNDYGINGILLGQLKAQGIIEQIAVLSDGQLQFPLCRIQS